MDTPEWWPLLLSDLQAEHIDLDRMVSGIGEDAWLRPTPAEGWDVRDSIGHLAYFDDAARMAIEDPAGFEARVQGVRSLRFDPIAEHLAKGRAMSSALVLQWWRDARTSLLQCLEHADPASRIAWYGPSMGTRSFVTARLMETWAHGQDVCDALGISREPTMRLRHIADLGVRTRGFSYAVRGMESPNENILVELTAPAPADGAGGGVDVWRWVTAGGGKVRDGREDSTLPAQFAGSIRGSALDFCLIVTERRNLADVSLQVDGEQALEWMKIAQAFAGPPGPGRPPLGSSFSRQRSA
ncbi:MAG: TIGR03084 family metal-binding protein [Actinobacteria bacterium]|nr:TIGR03084 family metal-binding protein [Actinomycetota bacterium]MCL5446267.1 TIGR03084 family metal-binding protein [Actinomycetota bacterium]